MGQTEGWNIVSNPPTSTLPSPVTIDALPFYQSQTGNHDPCLAIQQAIVSIGTAGVLVQGVTIDARGIEPLGVGTALPNCTVNPFPTVTGYANLTGSYCCRLRSSPQP